MKKKSIMLVASVLSFLGQTSLAQVPGIINYQGFVTVGGTNFNGTGQFQFAFVAGTNGGSLWSNDGSSTGGSQPSLAVPVPVSSGSFTVLLGDTTLPNMTMAISPSVFTNADVRVRVWFNDGVNGFQRLTPDQRIAAVGYALVAQSDSMVASLTGTVQTLQNVVGNSSNLWNSVTNRAPAFTALPYSIITNPPTILMTQNVVDITAPLFDTNGTALYLQGIPLTNASSVIWGTAFGINAYADPQSVAIGGNACGSLLWNGINDQNNTDGGIAIGYGATGSVVSIAIGYDARTAYYARDEGLYDIAIGSHTRAGTHTNNTDGNIAIGEWAEAYGVGSLAVGPYAYADGSYAGAFGFHCTNTLDHSWKFHQADSDTPNFQDNGLMATCLRLTVTSNALFQIGGLVITNANGKISGDFAGGSFSNIGSLSAATIILTNLPIADPHVKGQVWQSGTNLYISTGP